MRCRWFRPKPLTSFWLNVERAARQLRITVSCLLLSLRASNKRIKRGFSLGGWSTVRGTSELDSGGVETKRSPRQRDARQATTDVIFHSSSILDPATHLGLLLPGTCDVHPSSFLSGFSRPFIRASLAVEKAHGNIVSAENVCGQCRALPLTPRRSCCTDSFTFSTSQRRGSMQ